MGTGERFAELRVIGRRLADAVDTALMLRDLRESERKLKEAQRIAHVGHWDHDLDTDRIIWSDETWRIFGIPPRATITRADALERLHPDDRAILNNARALTLAGSSRVNVEFRVVLPHGEVRIVHSRGGARSRNRGTREPWRAGWLPYARDLVDPDFAKLAESAGILGICVEDPKDLQPALEAAFTA